MSSHDLDSLLEMMGELLFPFLGLDDLGNILSNEDIQWMVKWSRIEPRLWQAAVTDRDKVNKQFLEYWRNTIAEHPNNISIFEPSFQAESHRIIDLTLQLDTMDYALRQQLPDAEPEPNASPHPNNMTARQQHALNQECYPITVVRNFTYRSWLPELFRRPINIISADDYVILEQLLENHRFREPTDSKHVNVEMYRQKIESEMKESCQQHHTLIAHLDEPRRQCYRQAFDLLLVSECAHFYQLIYSLLYASTEGHPSSDRRLASCCRRLQRLLSDSFILSLYDDHARHVRIRLLARLYHWFNSQSSCPVMHRENIMMIYLHEMDQPYMLRMLERYAQQPQLLLIDAQAGYRARLVNIMQHINMQHPQVIQLIGELFIQLQRWIRDDHIAATRRPPALVQPEIDNSFAETTPTITTTPIHTSLSSTVSSSSDAPSTEPVALSVPVQTLSGSLRRDYENPLILFPRFRWFKNLFSIIHDRLDELPNPSPQVEQLIADIYIFTI